MALLKHLLLSFTIIIISFIACYSTLQDHEDPPSSIYVHDHSSSIDDGGAFNNLIKQSTNILSLDIYNKLGNIPRSSLKMVNVNDYGAKGNGHTDDTEAFKKAWEEVCSSGEAILVVPEENSYMLKPIRFSGPCEPNIQVQFSGTLEASDDPSDYSEDCRHWLLFENIKKLYVSGWGTINGNGNIWWQNSCKRNKKRPCKDAPTALTFYGCDDLIVENLTIENAQQIHVSFQDSVNVKVSGLNVTSPEDSPNTDGIHVTNTQNIQISNSVIGTGDDCISIVHGSRNVEAINITCGPGHGISIGSLGAGKSKEIVSGILVNGAKIFGTKNGVRIKTWQGGSGSASNIQFQNIEMDNVTNPIIINQNYCDKKKKPCNKRKSDVQIKNVVYQNIKGTSASDVAVKFDCSDKFPCQEITLQNIDLECEGGEDAEAFCNNVELSYLGHVRPRCNSENGKASTMFTSIWKDYLWYM
ncbi:polygalacturonase isoform X3 [Cajanus cajan]|uniref:endo-polygalacturonase n=1 Tax=Cajanus cajan TaxID=3821 RepID=A0A151TTX6_CAJCA|nr:polygalacturonase isoform X3 [Cajanus cajan]KYP70529.1 Polygalacturonase [Cajanus cajan]